MSALDVSPAELADQLDADIVVSSADPKTTFERLLGQRHLEAGFANRVHHLRTRGCVAKLHLALDGPPQFAGLDGGQGVDGAKAPVMVGAGGIVAAAVGTPLSGQGRRRVHDDLDGVLHAAQ